MRPLLRLLPFAQLAKRFPSIWIFIGKSFRLFFFFFRKVYVFSRWHSNVHSPPVLQMVVHVILFWGAFWVASVHFARVPLPEAKQMVLSQRGFELNRQPHYGQAVESTMSIHVRRDPRRSILTIHYSHKIFAMQFRTETNSHDRGDQPRYLTKKHDVIINKDWASFRKIEERKLFIHFFVRVPKKECLYKNWDQIINF